jgi:hypothetical protein
VFLGSTYEYLVIGRAGPAPVSQKWGVDMIKNDEKSREGF